jgi:site-specific DNA recombinase
MVTQSPPKINVDIDAILATVQLPPIPDHLFAGYAAIYIRVSSADQGERFSLPSQLKADLQKANAGNYRVKREHIFLDTHTGKLEKRPGFDKLRALVKTGAVKGVIIYSVDRFTRKVIHMLTVSAEFKQHGARLDFVEMPFEDTPTGRFMMTNLSAVAEFIGEKIIEDSKRGCREKLEEGKLTHGMAPFGYIYINKRQPNGARFEKTGDPKHAETIERVFKWRAIDKLPAYRIVKRLHELGLWSAKGGRWSRPTLHQMWRNPTYYGQHLRQGIFVACPAYVSEELWQAVQKVNEICRQQHSGRCSKNRYLLRGFLWCKKCSRRYTTSPGVRPGYKPRPSYRCGNFEYAPYRRLCDASQVFMDLIETAAWRAIWSLLKDPKLLLAMGEAAYRSLSKADDRSVEALKAERSRLEGAIATTRHMIQHNLMPFKEGGKDIRAFEKRIREIGEELIAAGQVRPLPPLRAAEAGLREITDGPEPSTYERRRDILEGIIDLRMTYLDGDLNITGKIPVPAAAQADSSSKNRCKGFGPDAERQREHHGDHQPLRTHQRSGRKSQIPQEDSHGGIVS